MVSATQIESFAIGGKALCTEKWTSRWIDHSEDFVRSKGADVKNRTLTRMILSFIILGATSVASAQEFTPRSEPKSKNNFDKLRSRSVSYKQSKYDSSTRFLTPEAFEEEYIEALVDLESRPRALSREQLSSHASRFSEEDKIVITYIERIPPEGNKPMSAQEYLDQKEHQEAYRARQNMKAAKDEMRFVESDMKYFDDIEKLFNVESAASLADVFAMGFDPGDRNLAKSCLELEKGKLRTLKANYKKAEKVYKSLEPFDGDEITETFDKESGNASAAKAKLKELAAKGHKVVSIKRLRAEHHLHLRKLVASVDFYGNQTSTKNKNLKRAGAGLLMAAPVVAGAASEQGEKRIQKIKEEGQYYIPRRPAGTAQ